MANVENGALQEAINNAAVGETVVLTENITLSGRVTVSNVVTLDLNGYTIYGDINDGYGAIYVGTKGVLTVVDSSSGQTGGIVNNIGNAIGNYGEVVIQSGTFVGNYALYNFYYSSSVYGKATINGGTFRAADENAPAVANCGDLIVSGGAIQSIDSTSVLRVTAGAIDNLYIGAADYSPAAQSTSINGGYVGKLTVADDSANNIVVSGGAFGAEIDSKYLAESVEFIYDEATGTYIAKASQGFKVIATSSSRIRELLIKDGQLIFIQDVNRIAFDFKGKRVFYNQIVELATEADRLSLEDPLDGYYFVIGSAVLWHYKSGWTQITEKPQEIIFIGVELPELGQEGTLYIDKEDREISVWDEETSAYIAVSNYTEDVTDSDIENLFN